MMISLAKKLSVGFILAVLAAIIIASVISNYTVGEKFKNYLVDEHKGKVNNVVRIIEDLYGKQKRILKADEDEIQRYAELQKLYIEIKDSNNVTLYSSGKSYLQHMGMMGSGNMMGGMMHNFNGINMLEYTEEKYPLEVNHTEEGSIVVGYFGASYISSASVTFISTLNHSFMVSAIAALAFGIIISIVISRQISKPLAKVIKTSNEIRNGDLSSRVVINSNTKEIVELSNSINYLAESLNNQEMLRKRLTSDMAHELRTPLTTLKTHVEAFIDGIWEPTNERFEVFYDEIQRMTKMVDNLRELSKLEQTSISLNKSKSNISKELEKIIDIFKPLYIKADYELYGNIPPDIIAMIDVDKFKQIMTNLIKNSYNYLNPKGKVEVKLEKDNENVLIKVIDNGIGIPEKDIPYIFERFYRSDLSRNKNTGGSGIGLTITKALVEAHGGKIYLESKVNEGTVVTIKFPKPMNLY